MPSETRKQQKWAYEELARKQKGQETDSGMTEQQLAEFAHALKAKPRKKGK